MELSILEIVNNNPHLTLEDIAAMLEISRDGVKYYIEKFKKRGTIRRIGGRRRGYWEVIK